MAKIFISYRRQDTEYAAGRLRDELGRRFGSSEVYFDVDTLQPPGHDFRIEIDRQVAESNYVIALIGDSWLTVRNEKGRPRLYDPNDWVRLEIETALRRRIPVIPVLVDNAQMPERHRLPDPLVELVNLQAHNLRPFDFARDVEELARRITEDQRARVPIPALPAVVQPRIPVWRVPKASPFGATGSSSKDAVRVPQRHVNVWLADSDPPLHTGKSYQVGVDIGRKREEALAGGVLHEPDWGTQDALELAIVLSGEHAEVQPGWQRATLPRLGQMAAVFFSVLPRHAGDLHLTLSIFSNRELTLLEKFDVVLAVEPEASTVKQ